VGVSKPRTNDTVRELAAALRLVGDREARYVVFAPAEPSPSFVQFTTDPGVLWGEVMSEASTSRRSLEALGWRPPAGHIPNWFQYFQITRKRDYRYLAEHVLETFRRGLGVRGAIVVDTIDRSSPADGPTFVPDRETISGYDRELLEMAAEIMGRFAPDVYDSHLEVTMRRKRHRVHIAVSACDGTLSCAA
jgi:hypothetical protein